MPRLGSGTRRQGRARVCVILFKEKAFAQQSIRRPWGPPQDLTRIVPVAIEICSAKGMPTGPRQKWFTATLVTSEGRKGLVGQPARHQGGKKGPIAQPGRLQGGRKRLIGQPGRLRRAPQLKGRDAELRGDTNVGSKWAPQLKGEDAELRQCTTVMNRVISLRRMQQPAARG